MKDFKEDQIDRINSLQNNQSFQLFKLWIRDSLWAERESSDRYEKTEDIRHSMGYRCALDDILNSLEEIQSES